MKPEELEKYLIRLQHEYNNASQPEFEGYSPNEIDYLIDGDFSQDSPIQMLKLSESDYEKIPILNQIKYLLNIIEQQGELKLTSTGCLPPKVVIDIYTQGFIKDNYIEKGISRLKREADSNSVNLTRLLGETTKLAKKRNGKLSLTKTAISLKNNNFELLKLIYTTLARKFNWGYYDGYVSENCGQLGSSFSLVLLSKYGKQKRLDTFYAEKYHKAFPEILDEFDYPNGTTNSFTSCYSIRTFDRFLDYFGVIKIEVEGDWRNELKYITKTDLFDKLFKCVPHKVLKVDNDVSKIIKLFGKTN